MKITKINIINHLKTSLDFVFTNKELIWKVLQSHIHILVCILGLQEGVQVTGDKLYLRSITVRKKSMRF